MRKHFVLFIELGPLDKKGFQVFYLEKNCIFGISQVHLVIKILKLKCTIFILFFSDCADKIVAGLNKGQHTVSKWTFTQKKCNGNFKHSPRNYMPSGSQNRFWINP